MEQAQKQCPRTLALWMPGVPQGTPCHFVFTGYMPCTGPQFCTMCGARKEG